MNGASVMGQYEDQENVNVVDHNQGFDYLINLDAETEGEVVVSCAGGYNGTYTMEFTPPTGNEGEGASLEAISNDTLYQLDIKGGMGGHSGINMINDPINAPISCAQYLSLFPSIGTDNIIQLVKIDSYQEVGNVIPGDATFIFAMPKLSAELETERLHKLQEALSDFMEDVKFYHPKETNLSAEVDTYKGSDTFTYKLKLENSKHLLNLLTDLKFGAQQTRTLPDGSKELVSSSNVCPVNLLLETAGGNTPHFDFSIFDRSENEWYLFYNYVLYTKTKMNEFLVQCEGDVNMKAKKNSQYPAYVYNPYDMIREKIMNMYERLGIQTSEQRTHGGIECA
ncbi:MAG: hypothetical protein MJ219_00675 [Mycoplasmoidaceae bacterium]|nr:hypothetical protein [Mycoplasmoidaceae bacterium]